MRLASSWQALKNQYAAGPSVQVRRPKLAELPMHIEHGVVDLREPSIPAHRDTLSFARREAGIEAP